MDHISLTQRAADQLAVARESSNGRSSHSLYGDREHLLRHMLMALTAGTSLGEHASPGEATLQVLEGEVTLSGLDESWTLAAGDFVAIPPERHDLTAITDAVVLLTVAKDAHH
ncbi:MAG: LuxR family transcriptional regulator [Actinobacteria bacterium HGW-Actinobacteria-4]|nr:MAG: LuxR family transcriptional regulator [Actinobacteria bacterium HGW-Actinobacteria-4]